MWPAMVDGLLGFIIVCVVDLSIYTSASSMRLKLQEASAQGKQRYTEKTWMLPLSPEAGPGEFSLNSLNPKQPTDSRVEGACSRC